MYKIVKDFVDSPVLLMMCDASCAAVVQSTVPPGIESAQVEPGFIKQAMQAGWFVSLGRQLCPHHHVAMRADQPMVQAVRSVLVS